MSSFQAGSVDNKPYVDPTPLPDHVPKVAELGVTSAPLKSAAFFVGAYCKDFNGQYRLLYLTVLLLKECHSRGFHALQGREPGSRSLSEGGTKGDPMRDRPVRFSSALARVEPIPSIPFQLDAGSQK